MGTNIKLYTLLLIVLATVSRQAFAPPTITPLPFGDGPLIALSVACVVGVAWLTRRKKK